MIDFIQDDDRLRDERKKAKKNKDKYVGMSSDALGFRGSSSRGGFESGWQDKWPPSGARSVTPTGSGGFCDSPTDFDSPSSADYNSRRSPVDEFKDNSDNVQGDQNSIQDLGYSTINNSSGPSPTSANSSGNAGAAKPAKVRKPIDLGAAATYAQNAAAAQPTPAAAAAPAAAPVQQNKQLIDDLFNTSNGTEDDFDPRGGSSAPSGGANGDFGNFSTAFGNSDAAAAPEGDGFADFSSAFTPASGGAAPPAEPAAASSNSLSDDLFASLPATSNNTPAFQPARPPSNPSFDLFGGGAPAPQQTTTPSFNNSSLLVGTLSLIHI